MTAETDDELEIYRPPLFDPGSRVRARRSVKNDGTMPGCEIGDEVVHIGDEGYVRSVGTFLNRFYVYGVEFVARGRVVGMRGKELDALERAEEQAP